MPNTKIRSSMKLLNPFFVWFVSISRASLQSARYWSQIGSRSWPQSDQVICKSSLAKSYYRIGVSPTTAVTNVEFVAECHLHLIKMVTSPRRSEMKLHLRKSNHESNMTSALDKGTRPDVVCKAPPALLTIHQNTAHQQDNSAKPDMKRMCHNFLHLATSPQVRLSWCRKLHLLYLRRRPHHSFDRNQTLYSRQSRRTSSVIHTVRIWTQYTQPLASWTWEPDSISWTVLKYIQEGEAI